MKLFFFDLYAVQSGLFKAPHRIFVNGYLNCHCDFRWKKMALFCRVLYAQCALKVYEQFHRKQQQRARLHAARADRPLVSAGAVQTAEKDARLSRSSSDSNVAAMPGRTRHARSSSAGGVGGTDHAFHDALWAVFDVLVSYRITCRVCPHCIAFLFAGNKRCRTLAVVVGCRFPAQNIFASLTRCCVRSRNDISLHVFFSIKCLELLY